MPFDWAGTRILQKNTVLADKRRVFNNSDTLVPTDLREWVTPGDREEIRRALRDMELPVDREPGSFDGRARIVWRWVVDSITYTEDPEEQMLVDFWQFPAETIAIKKGDCEDCAFLLASLLLGSGVSSYCVRVVFGSVVQQGEVAVPHAWTIYKDEKGKWRLLEATLPNGAPLDEMPSAESCASKHTGLPTYTPILCVNTEHVWQIGRRRRVRDVGSFVSDHAEQKKVWRKSRLESLSKS
ncbi:MAG: transglutaminase domain-containing protein [bacterium]|nr:transglutaminase domain-containing protein [bacterium]